MLTRFIVDKNQAAAPSASDSNIMNRQQKAGCCHTGRFVMVQNYLQAKALLEHDYVIFIGDPIIGLPLYSCFLRGSIIIFVEYLFPNAAILRDGDWTKFEKLYQVAEESDTIMFTIMQGT